MQFGKIQQFDSASGTVIIRDEAGHDHATSRENSRHLVGGKSDTRFQRLVATGSSLRQPVLQEDVVFEYDGGLCLWGFRSRYDSLAA